MESTASPSNYLTSEHGIASWLLTKDHKRIGILYLVSITLFFLLGGVFAGLIRIELLTPAGDLVESDTYNKMFTMHGIIMIFFFLVPSIPSVLGNFLVPLMIGARDLAFPRINLLSWYIYIIGGILTLGAMITGGVDTGWTFYTPFSTTASNTNVVPTAVAIFITGFSSILTGLNFIVTIHRMRAPGLTWFRLPLFIWAHYATSLILVLGTPVPRPLEVERDHRGADLLAAADDQRLGREPQTGHNHVQVEEGKRRHHLGRSNYHTYNREPETRRRPTHSERHNKPQDRRTRTTGTTRTLQTTLQPRSRPGPHNR